MINELKNLKKGHPRALKAPTELYREVHCFDRFDREVFIFIFFLEST